MQVTIVLHKTLQPIRSVYNYLELPAAAKFEHLRDHLGLPKPSLGINKAIDETVAWLCRAQDNSASYDGGVARHFSLITGWATSYPETTGYIVPTMLAYAKLRMDESIRRRAKRMLDWLLSIQLTDGSFQGGAIGSEKPLAPVTFNTGQILLGLACGVQEIGEQYRSRMCRAADWLVETQDPDGCWRKHFTPFARTGEKAFDTHVAWGLLEAARIEPNKRYADTALANVSWALGLQRDNGWFDKCCLSDPTQPLIHTLGYVLRGIIEAYKFTGENALLNASRKTADGLLKAFRFRDGFLPGRLDGNWRGTVPWACLTGTAQIAHCFLMLYRYTDEIRYRDAAYSANRYVRRTIKVRGPAEVRGAIKGSFPVYGGYGPYQYLSWAAKFFIDSSMLEQDVRKQ